jgi:hypothetical protein
MTRGETAGERSLARFSGPRLRIDLVNGVVLFGRITAARGDGITVELDEWDLIELPAAAILTTWLAEAG